MHLPAPPTATSESVRRVMVANRRRDTTPEVALRRELHRRGLRFRVDHSPIEGLRCRIDVVFVRSRLAIFVDGCFWHRCPDHGNVPRANTDYWTAKLTLNTERDKRNNRALEEAGWTVLRVWEHEDPKAAADRVEAALSRELDQQPPQTIPRRELRQSQANGMAAGGRL